MIWFSFAIGDMTQGIVPIPLWIPQSGMGLGLTLLTLALLLEAWSIAHRRDPTYLIAEREAAEARLAS